MRLVGIMLLTACAPLDPGPYFELPPEIAWTAVVTYDADERFIEATGLQAVPEARVLEAVIPADAERIVVIGYAESDLAKYPFRGSEATPLRPRGPMDPAVPAPSYAAAANTADARATMLEGPVELSADWLDACPDFTALDARLDCAETACVPRLTQKGCTLLIVPDGCTTGSFTVQLLPSGEVGAASGDPNSECSAIEPPVGALSAFHCSGQTECTVDLSPHEPPPARFDMERVRLFEAEFNALARYISSAVVFEDRIVAATFDGRADNFDCVSTAPSRFYLIPLDGTAVASVEAPPCATLATRYGDGFVAAYGAPDRNLGWFDRDGALLATLPVPEVYAIRLLVLSGDRAWLLGQFEGDQLYRILSVDLVRHTIDATADIARTELEAMSIGEELFIADDDADEGLFFDPITLEQLATVMLSTTEFFSVEVKSAAYDVEAGRALALIGSVHAGVTFVAPTGLQGRALNFSVDDFEPLAALRSPFDPRYFITALINRHGGSGVIGLLDPIERRFLPGIEAAPLDDGTELDLLVTNGEVVVAIGQQRADLVLIRRRP